MGLTASEIVERVRAALPDDIIVATEDDVAEADETKKKAPETIDPFVLAKPESLRKVCEWLCYEPDLRFDLLHCISNIDYPDRNVIQVIYHLDSIRHKHTFTVKVDLDRADPKVESMVPLWPAADWHERESFDLMGVIHTGHPNLKRILCADDWVGHPLRKDYEFPEEYHGIPCGPYVTEYANIPPEHEVWLKEFEAEDAAKRGGPSS